MFISVQINDAPTPESRWNPLSTPRAALTSLAPKCGSLHTPLDVLHVLAPLLGDQAGLALLQAPPLGSLLLLPELPLHFLLHHLLYKWVTVSHPITMRFVPMQQFKRQAMYAIRSEHLGNKMFDMANAVFHQRMEELPNSVKVPPGGAKEKKSLSIE